MPASGGCLRTDVVDWLNEPSKKINIVDSDVAKPDGCKFEALGIVRDGSVSASIKNVYKKGYHVTEACALTSGNHTDFLSRYGCISRLEPEMPYEMRESLRDTYGVYDYGYTVTLTERMS